MKRMSRILGAPEELDPRVDRPYSQPPWIEGQNGCSSVWFLCSLVEAEHDEESAMLNQQGRRSRFLH